MYFLNNLFFATLIIVYFFVKNIFMILIDCFRNSIVNVLIYSLMSLFIINNFFFIFDNKKMCQIKTFFFKQRKKLFLMISFSNV